MALPRLGARFWVLLLLLAMASTEFGLRRAGFAAAAAAELDPDLGWRKQPSQSVPGIWGEGVEINGHGFRDRTWADPSEAEQSVLSGGQRGLRVAVLGDSVGYGAGVEVERGFARLLEGGLRGKLGPDVLVQNFSIPGWTLEQMVKAYELEASRWKPDVVVLLAGTACVRPALPVKLGSHYPLRRTVERTAVWDFLRRRVLRDPTAEEQAALPELRGREHIVKDPYGEQAQPFWTEAGAHLGRLGSAVETDGAELLVVLVPRLMELTRADWRSSSSGVDRAAEHWQRMLEEAPSAGFLDLRMMFRLQLLPVMKQAAEQGVPLHRVWGKQAKADGLVSVDQATHPYLVGDSTHLSSWGHSILAADTFRKLGRAGWLP